MSVNRKGDVRYGSIPEKADYNMVLLEDDE